MTTTPIFSTTVKSMPVTVYNNNTEVGQAAAADAFEYLKQVLRDRGHANVILATGNSQLTFLETLRQATEIDWSKINFFHMDEYINLPESHPASFPLFLKRHFLDHIHPAAGAFYPVPGLHTKPGESPEGAPGLKEYEKLLRENPADLCALGIGENGHLAFNDPPFADFNDTVWVKTIKLDERSRKQQFGEGHFPDLESVPTHAITLTIPALLAARKVLAIVPEQRKAEAVRRSLVGPVDANCPASILREHAHVHLYLDRDSASLTYELQG